MRTTLRTGLRTLLRAVRVIWLILGITLLLVLTLEAGARFGLNRVPTTDAHWYKDAFQGAEGPWLQTFSAELDQTTSAFANVPTRRRTSVAWRPFDYWRSKPYQGQYINVDRNGIRVTKSPAPSTTTAQPLRIFMFGGSTMWGAGVRDDKTIPSQFAEQLQQLGITAETVNFGQIGYVSTQELICLVRELQAGNIPHVAVFFDGYNDFFALTENHVPGLSLGEPERRREFQMGRQPTRAWAIGLVESCGIYRACQLLAPRPMIETYTSDPGPVSSAALLDLYKSNLAIVDGLAKKYDFRAFFFWQPTVFDKRQASTAELETIGRHELDEKSLRAVSRIVKQQQDSLAPADHDEPIVTFRFLGELFDHPDWDGRTAFYDYCHTTETANQVIAREMARAVADTTHEPSQQSQTP